MRGLEVEGDLLNDAFCIRANGNFITVENCSVGNIGKTGSLGFGIVYEFGSKNGLITQNIVENTGLDGIHIRGTENTVVSNNKILDSNDDGIASILGYNNLIINNSIDRNGTTNLAGNGIYTADKGTTIQSNNIKNTPLNGITADYFQDNQANGIKIVNNTVTNAGKVTGNIPYGGILLNYADNSTVSGNIIDSSLYYGIRIYNGSRNSILKTSFLIIMKQRVLGGPQ